FIMLTRAGKAIRAVSEDKEASSLMGINVDGMISTTFVIGGMSAGAAGVLYALMFKQVHFFMGFIPGIKAFTGNIPGAMLGGIFLGLIESVGPSLFLDGLGIPAPYQLKDAIAFTMLVLVLIFRPTGIMGGYDTNALVMGTRHKNRRYWRCYRTAHRTGGHGGVV
ncbi:MAG: branched-chain amino acid ABC transporter permease, partial [Deltaproteobacteria bacterium]|nr:branched-chain amino acid ABC transporter permease [Deltaproteobacteria bacterium]